MNLKRRIEKLENKNMSGINGLHIIELEEYGETNDQAIQRYCAEKGFDVEEFENRAPGSLAIILNKFGR